MSRITHISLLCRGAAEGVRAGLFGSGRSLEKTDGQGLPNGLGNSRFHTALSSPEPCARQTAAIFGNDCIADERLADIDFGRWRDRSLAEIAASEAEGLQAWMSDPHACPHGGETIAQFYQRITGWLDDFSPGGGRALVVTHPSVIRCLVMGVVDAPLSAFWKIDIDYGRMTELTGNGKRWTLRALNLQPAGPGGDA